MPEVSETVKRETATGESPSEIYSAEEWLSEVFSQQWTPDLKTLQNESTDVESSLYDAELKEIASERTSQTSSINLTKISKSTRYLEDLPHPSRLRLKGRPERKIKQFNATTDISCHLSQLRRKEKYCLGDVQNEFLRARKDFLGLQRHRRLKFEKFKDTMDAVSLDSLQVQTTFPSAGSTTCEDATDQQCIKQGHEWQNQSLQCNMAQLDFTDKIDQFSFYKAPTLGTKSCPNSHSSRFDTSQANLWTQTFTNQRMPLNPKELDISPKSTSNNVTFGHDDFYGHGEMLNPQDVHGTGRRTIFEDLSIATDDIPGINHHSLSNDHTEYMGCAEKIGQHLSHEGLEPCCGDDASNPIFDQASFWKTPMSAGGQHVEDELQRSYYTHIETTPIIKDRNFKYELSQATEGDPFTTPSRRIADIEYDEIHHDTSGEQ